MQTKTAIFEMSFRLKYAYVMYLTENHLKQHILPLAIDYLHFSVIARYAATKQNFDRSRRFPPVVSATFLVLALLGWLLPVRMTE